MPRLVYLANVVTLKLDENKCAGCGMCLLVCPHEVFSPVGGRVEIKDRDRCMECGACARNCPAGAVTVSAGVGCATAVINAALGRKGGSCCCTIDKKDENAVAPESSSKNSGTHCC
jgi:ferredoxin